MTPLGTAGDLQVTSARSAGWSNLTETLRGAEGPENDIVYSSYNIMTLLVTVTQYATITSLASNARQKSGRHGCLVM